MTFRASGNESYAIKYIRAQIDNLLRLDTLNENITFMTNFRFSYRGVQTVTVPELHQYRRYFEYKYFSVMAAKRLGMIDRDIWLHDLDVWQNMKFDRAPFKDAGGVLQKRCINGGSIFFRASGLDMIEATMQEVLKKKGSDEHRITKMAYKNRDRFSILNPTWNLGISYFNNRLAVADKPIMVLHFHPEKYVDKYKYCCLSLKNILEEYWNTK